MIRSLLWMFVFFLALQYDHHHQVAAVKEIVCNPSSLQARGFYALEKHRGEMQLKIIDPNMELKDTGIWRVKLGKAENQEYRLFFQSKYKLLVVSCFFDEEEVNKRICGYYQHQFHTAFEDKAKAKEAIDLVNLGWWYEPFSFKNFNDSENYIDMSKIYFEEDDKGTRRIHLNEHYYYDFAKEVGRNRTAAMVKRLIDDNCFKPGYHCAYDLRWKRVVEVKDTPDENGNVAIPLYFYGPHKFSVDKDHFLYDNLFGLYCYGSTTTYELLLPYLSPDVVEVSPSLFVKEFDDKKTSKIPKECPEKGLLQVIEDELGPPKKPDDDYYEDSGVPKGENGVRLNNLDDKCKDDQVYFYVFIASAVIAGIITCLFIALVVVIVIAKKKMIKQGHRLPKKPWETQATEDCATLLDQTVGVTEATTVGGETSAYTTIGQQ